MHIQFFIFTCLPFLAFLIPYCGLKFISVVISFQPKEFPSVFVVGQVCRQQILLVFICECVYFTFIFEEKFSWLQKSWVTGLSSLNTLPMSVYCLLISTVSDKKSAVNHIAVPLYMMNYFVLAAFKFLFLCLAFSSFTMRCGSLCVYLNWSLMIFLDV